MKVCYFGTYDPVYTRNRLMIKGLKENGVEVIECRTPQIKNKLKKYKELIKLHKKIKKEYDVMVVGFAGHAIMPLAWLLAKLNRKKVVLDLFVSEYDSVILDRKSYSKFSPQAVKFWILDWLSCKLADICLLDADEHIRYFVKAFKTKAKKFRMIFVSADPAIFSPREKETSEKFVVHYHGSYSPIQGAKYIVEAAKVVESQRDIIFNIIGKTGHYKKEIELAKNSGLNNVNFIDAMPYEDLADQMASSDLVLGMFGDTDKAMHCSAFKIVEGMAMKKPVLTGDTPALRELIQDKETGLFCRMADAKDLADKIIELKNNNELMKKIAENGYQFYLDNLTPKKTAGELIKVLNKLINNQELRIK